MITDSHCHLDYPILYDKLDDIVERAKKNNVNNLLTICTTLESFDKIKFIINKYKNIYGTFGIHPHESSKYPEVNSDFIYKIKKLLELEKLGLIFIIITVTKKFKQKVFLSTFMPHQN